MSLQRQHFLLSYLKTLSVGPAGVRTHDLRHGSPVLNQLSQLPVRYKTAHGRSLGIVVCDVNTGLPLSRISLWRTSSETQGQLVGAKEFSWAKVSPTKIPSSRLAAPGSPTTSFPGLFPSMLGGARRWVSEDVWRSVFLLQRKKTWCSGVLRSVVATRKTR